MVHHRGSPTERAGIQSIGGSFAHETGSARNAEISVQNGCTFYVLPVGDCCLGSAVAVRCIGTEICGETGRRKKDRLVACRTAVLANRELSYACSGAGCVRAHIAGRRSLWKGLVVYARVQGRPRAWRNPRYRNRTCADCYCSRISPTHKPCWRSARSQNVRAFASRLGSLLRVVRPARTKDVAWRQLRRGGAAHEWT